MSPSRSRVPEPSSCRPWGPLAVSLVLAACVTPAGGSDASTGSDAGTESDAGTVEGGRDAGTVDAGTVDAGTVDAGTVDAGTVDAGTVDAGTVDAGTVDAGTVDAGTVDAGEADAGGPDAGPCTPESGAVLCAQAGFDCGDAGLVDRCGTMVTVDCGQCQRPLTCGGAGQPQACGRVAPMRPGLDVPSPVNPTVEISDSLWVKHVFRVALGRDPDALGYRAALRALRTQSRVQFFQAVIWPSTEFRANAALADKTAYVTRAYQELLRRAPDAPGLTGWVATLGDVATSTGAEWAALLDGFTGNAEYKAANCHTGSWAYGQPLQADAPTLTDLISGTAQFQALGASEPLEIPLPPSVRAMWDTKVTVFHGPDGGAYSMVRAHQAATSDAGRFNRDHFTIWLAASSSGARFDMVGRVFDEDDALLTSYTEFYDPHVAVDYSVCPPRYVMAMECDSTLCLADSQVPFDPNSWGVPRTTVTYASDGGWRSASTGVAFIDGANRYLSWSVVDDSATLQTSYQVPDDGNESTSSRGAQVGSYAPPVGTADEGVELLGATRDIFCTSAWDCNNRDKQDWRREGPNYFLIYNGANYYRCIRPFDPASGAPLNTPDAGQPTTSAWGLSIAHGTAPLGPYTPGPPLLLAPLTWTCAISYPVVNAVGGRLYLYFASVEALADAGVGFASRRSRLEWKP